MKNRNIFVWSVILLAVNMRIPITAVSSLIPALQKQLGLSTSAAGMITTIPMLTFAVASPLFPRLARRFGIERVILFFTALLSIGMALRILPNAAGLFAGTFLIGLGIDSANVLLPASIKAHYTGVTTRGMSYYTTTMMVAGALATGIVGLFVDSASLTAIQVGLFVVSLISLVGWIPATTVKLPNAEHEVTEDDVLAESKRSVWGTKTGWLITIFFSLQAIIFYSLLTWLSSAYISFGMSAGQASLLVTVFQLCGMPFSLIVPLVANTKWGVQSTAAVMGGGLIIGLVLTLVAGANFGLSMIAAIIMGLGNGVSFNLAVVFFAQKSANHRETAAVSGMAQSAGYLIAAVGPVLFGIVGSHLDWHFALILAAIFAGIMWLTGIIIHHQKSIFA